MQYAQLSSSAEATDTVAPAGQHSKASDFFKYHGIWAPGVRLFRQLTFGAKAAIISAVFLIPLLQLGWFFFKGNLEVVNFSAKERQGVRYVQALAPVLQAGEALRLVAVTDTGDAAAAQQQTQKAVAALASVDQELGEGLETRALFKDIQTLSAQALASRGDAEAAFAQHSQLLDKALALVTQVSDGSNLTLDPDLDSYYLMDAALFRVPVLNDLLARARADSQVGFAKGAFAPDQGERLREGAPVLAFHLAALQDGLHKVLAARPDLAAALQADAVQQTTADALAQLRRQALQPGGPQGDGAALQASLQKAQDELQAFWSRDLAALDQLLVDRLEARQAQTRHVIALVVLCLAMAGYLFVSFAKVMHGGLREVREHLEAMTQGDLTASPKPWGRDEAASLMATLGQMQTSLRNIVAQVRKGSDHIVHSSSEISEGTLDLSSRTEQAAANLQESASSMEEISSTVQATADHAKEAAEIARHNADVARRGGEVMGSVVGTMEEIRQSSSKIGDIIGVIDGIAFQTNILALNAAVEAARAGDAGRGFAVVATEVRQLAHRSAGAAREIKTLISGSVERIEAGAAVARDAGSTIQDVVEGAQRMRALLDEIANGANEQSSGVTQIGAAVQDLDRMTQQNAALVEETAAAAGMLKDRAHELAGEVGRFRLPEGFHLRSSQPSGAAAVGQDFDFDAAIAAHREWKIRLRSAMAEHGQLDADTLCRDDQCPLGRWLHGPGGAQWGSKPSFRALVDKHAEFHTCAGEVARRINLGQMDQAERLIGSGSRFSQISGEVSTLLTQAKRQYHH